MKIYYRKTRQILKSRFVVRSENDCSLSSRQSCLLQIIFKGIRLILMGWNGSPPADLEEVVTAIFAVHSISLHFFLLQGILVNPCSSASPSVPWNDNCGKLALGHSHILIWRGKDLHLHQMFFETALHCPCLPVLSKKPPAIVLSWRNSRRMRAVAPLCLPQGAKSMLSFF